MPSIAFTVDAALLRELGERLVGRPHIALAELIKNAYDADATVVEVIFDTDRIEVADNGHGMDFDAFKNFWMRVGSPHKERQRYSKAFRRPLTGSKGVGRLAAQFLARNLELLTAPDDDPDSALVASVDWEQAVRSGDLTSAHARYSRVKRRDFFPNQSPSGTRLILTNLSQTWSPGAFRELAREIWWLQPPFRSASASPRAFEVALRSSEAAIVESFDGQMRAALDLWQARIVGELQDHDDEAITAGSTTACRRIVRISLERPNGHRRVLEQVIDDCRIDHVSFEIRVFKLQYRQPHGIKVGDLRNYFNEYGGVHVYDAGFRLPYYGPDTDWLKIEMDHSHRVVRSRLLPDDLQAPGGLTYLPTNSRLFGVVNIDTAHEREAARRLTQGGTEYLQIQVSRDRLVDNGAYDDLARIVRTGLDFFAVDEARRVADQEQAHRPETVTAKAAHIEDVLEEFRPEIPEHVYGRLRLGIEEVIAASESQAETLLRRAGLLGALATAGISALAWEHEAAKHYDLLEGLADRLEAMTQEPALVVVAADIRRWIESARATRLMFSALLDEEARAETHRYKVRAVLDDVGDQVGHIARGLRIENDVDPAMRLPAGTYAEWTALFQNVLLNASNAMLDVDEKLIKVHSRTIGQRQEVLIEDVGVGVDLSEANAPSRSLGARRRDDATVDVDREGA